MMSSLAVLFHLLAFIVDFYALYYDLNYIKIGTDGLGGKYKFLTIWNITFQCFYFGLCVVTDLSSSEPGPTNVLTRGKLTRWRDNFHAVVAFPVGMFVVVTFWVLYLVDRELVYPESLDKIIPPVINHILHTTVLPFILLDKYFIYHNHPSQWRGLSGTIAVAGCYLIWILFIAYYENFWVYPILQVLESHQRAVFIVICLLFFASQYILGQSLTQFIWRKQRSTLKKLK
ncbi:androgen-induced gene 1 protein-like [Biomphalaria glabrata]|uniref:Androgen-induced gene 1 protein-like n=1 Tax=Biomphalaria glabrata TaxID=6526 RepID=A0A9U8EGV1_BIOGL|nr:androgen-induced gene 1 protein-like [Biomphalaria glabrata]KAI8776401.1 androgen-induced gene 1 protein [Biomphalaria glabrata]